MAGPAGLGIFVFAALAEIGGCYAVWLWLRQDRSAIWAIAGVALLILFAWLLTRLDSGVAGRAFAAYGGIYICLSLGWMCAVEGVRPDRWDYAGAALCMAGSMVILLAHRPA